MVFEFVSLVQLCDSVAVISLLAYLLTRTKYSSVFVLQKNTLFSILFMSLTGALLYLYGVITGIEIGPYLISIQMVGPVIAGIIAGPASGLIAGMAGIILQIMFGYSIPPVESLIVLISGLIGGGYWYFNKGKEFQLTHIFILAILIGFIQFFAGIRGVKPDILDQGEVLEAILDLFIPTIVALCIFVFIINNLIKEDENNRKTLHIEGELFAAREIQLGALPAQRKEWEKVSIAASLEPASFVGGDLYDYQELDDGSIYFALGDVSGKGVPAALLMSSTRMVLRSKLREVRDPCLLIQEINRSFLEDGDCKQFITLIVGFLSPQTGEVRYCNAGHPPPCVIHTTGCTEHNSDGNLPAGVMEDETYIPHHFTMNPGEILLLVSDGVTEAEHDEELFGSERILEIIRKKDPCNPDELVNVLHTAVKDWTGDNPLSDDCTILAIGYYPER